MDVRKEKSKGVHEEGKVKEKIKEKRTITREGYVDANGEVQGEQHVETDLKRECDKSTTEKIGEAVRGAGHAISETFSEGARKIGLKD